MQPAHDHKWAEEIICASQRCYAIACMYNENMVPFALHIFLPSEGRVKKIVNWKWIAWLDADNNLEEMFTRSDSTNTAHINVFLSLINRLFGTLIGQLVVKVVFLVNPNMKQHALPQWKMAFVRYSICYSIAIAIATTSGNRDWYVTAKTWKFFHFIAQSYFVK